MIKLRILMAVLALAWLPASATTHFVKAGGSGTGASWATAWTSPSTINWSVLAAGDVVCIAGGTYAGGISTGKSGTSGNPITLQRATASDPNCGSSTAGWSGAFDAQVNFGNSGITLQNDFITIDGMVASGILLNLANSSGSPSSIGVAGPTNTVTLRHIEVAGPCGTTACNQNGDGRSVDLNHFNGASYDLQNNMSLQYMNLHGSCTILWSAHSTNLLIEHSRFADSADSTPGNPNCHPNVIAEQDSTNVTFRYNEITNWQVEGIMACPNGGCASSWNIYGNLWHDPMGGSFPRVLEAQGNANGPYLFYNNTVVNVSFTVFNTANGGSFLAGSQSRNNIYWNSAGGPGLPSNDYDYSDAALSEAHGQGSAANPFVSLAGKNFHLTGHTNAGLNLGSPYNTDYDGNVRTTWDRGAYEFGSGTSRQSASRTFTLTINPSVPPLSITTTSPLPGGTQGVAYNANMAATGGVPPYTWTLASGALPPGLSLSGAGAITGQPTSIGVATSVIRVTDSASTAVTGTFRITISCVALVISSTSPLPPGTVSTPYSDQLQSQGGTGALTWSLSSGSFPTGLSISAGGLISGTPSASGLFTPTIGLQDSCSTPQTTTQAFSLTIAASLTITTTSPLPAATPGQPYSTTLTAAGGSPPYTWAVTSGTLPAGLSLNASTGVISGTPTSAGFVQVNAATPSTNSSSVPVVFLSNQASGNTNVVAVGWSDTVSTVSTITDTRGNTYTQAGSMVTGTGRRQVIYYAKNIAAGSNTVTVNLNQAAPFVDVRILEYSGLDTTSPLDVTAGAFGTSTAANSGAATTTSANEIIFGAGSTANKFTAPGSGFTSRIITNPNGDIAEDKVVSTAGSNSATATVGASAAWVMQMAAFKAVGGLGSSTFTIRVTDNAAQNVSKVFTMNQPPHTVTLTWTASVTPGVTYNVNRGTTTGGPWPVSVASGISGLTAVDQTVQPATTYFYVVTSQIGSSVSGPSNQATACIPSQPACP